MVDITSKSTATLVDELFTTLCKCWFFQEVVMHGENDAVVADAARKAQQSNARRNQLMRALDERLGESEIAALVKSYDIEDVKRIMDDAGTES